MNKRILHTTANLGKLEKQKYELRCLVQMYLQTEDVAKATKAFNQLVDLIKLKGVNDE